MKRIGGGSQPFTVRSAYGNPNKLGLLVAPRVKFREFTPILLCVVLFLTVGPPPSSGLASPTGPTRPNKPLKVETLADDSAEEQTGSRNTYTAAITETYVFQVQSLLRKMSLEEKVGQFPQLDAGTVKDGTGSSARINTAKLDLAMKQYCVGSSLNAPGGEALTGERWHQIIHNARNRHGEEVVQLYETPHVTAVTGPVKRLKGFQKVALQPGQTRTIQFRLGIPRFHLGGFRRAATYPGNGAW